MAARLNICFMHLFVLVAQLVAQNTHLMTMSIMSGWQFQCANTTCLPFATTRMLNIRNCQIACLDQVQCQAITFHQSSSSCELFSNILNQNRNMSINAGTITMIDMSGTRLSNGSITVSTTATTTGK
ncbi:unnamed protein product [Adineta steineri]|uniref:Apple domain-containing protein n=1 Tax=Adineta steineri TaxID=433720 RepID=A0A813RPM3_9BILA|nr:unnamed protein product [Adineta steineri]